MAVKLATTLMLLISAPAVTLQLRDSLQAQEITNGPSFFTWRRPLKQGIYTTTETWQLVLCVWNSKDIFKSSLSQF